MPCDQNGIIYVSSHANRFFSPIDTLGVWNKRPHCTLLHFYSTEYPTSRGEEKTESTLFWLREFEK